MIKLSPSLLSADFSKLGEEIVRLERAGADMIHIDVMDGHFVPNITIGPPVVRALRGTTGLKFDVHLMIDRPQDYIDAFIDAGADIVSFHIECECDTAKVIEAIKNRKKKAAVAINPATSLDKLSTYLDRLDMVLIMTVNPGLPGQSYIEGMTEKIKRLSEIAGNGKYKFDIEVDGGISLDNIYRVTEAGANIIVSGSAIFNAVNMNSYIKSMREAAWKEGYEDGADYL